MSPLLQKLVGLVPPPKLPSGNGGDWKQLEHSLGVVLPSDYKEYIDCYGGGLLCSLLAIASPFTLESHYRLTPKEAWAKWAGIYSDWIDEPVENLPYSVFPTVPGLLPFGTYGDVDVLGWLTSADSEHWHLVYRDREQGFFELPKVSFLQFLVSAIQGDDLLPRSVFGEDLGEVARTFRPDS